MKHFSGNKKGYLLPMVIIYMVTAMIVGTGIVLLGSLDRIEANKRLHREQAFYLAEAGINLARFNLKNSSSWVPIPNPMTVNLGAGSFQLIQTVNGNTVTDTSIGTVKGLLPERIVLTVTKGGSVFGQGVFGKSQIYIDGSSQISGYDSRTGATTDAKVNSNLSVYIPSSGRIFGDASVASGGTISYPAWSPDAITGDTTLNGTPRILPPVTIPSDLFNLPLISYGSVGLNGNYQVSNGNYTVNIWPMVAGITAGNYHFRSLSIDSDAQFTISGTVRLYIENALSITNNSNGIILGSGASLTIYMGATNGTVTFDNGGCLNYNNSPGNVAIYVASNKPVQLLSNCRINAAIYAPNSLCTVANSSELRGEIVADRVSLPGNAMIFDDAALREIPPPGDGSGGINFVSWTKPDWVK